MKSFVKFCNITTLIVYIFAATPAFASQTQDCLPQKFKLQSIFAKDVKTNLKDSNGYQVIDFWASWCQSCKTNLDMLEPLQLKMTKKNLPHKVLAVSVDESKAEAQSFFDEDGPGGKLKAMRKNAWLDANQKLSNQLNFEGVPFLVVVDPKGKIVMRHSGTLVKADIKKIENLIKK